MVILHIHVPNGYKKSKIWDHPFAVILDIKLVSTRLNINYLRNPASAQAFEKNSEKKSKFNIELDTI